MTHERYRLLAAVVAAHPQSQVVGRTRLQKTVKLLQRLGLPTDYLYTLHFYGPYSEGVQAEIGVLEQFGLVAEAAKENQSGRPYYVLTARPEANLAEVEKFKPAIELMSSVPSVVLELAATYDAFRESGNDHRQALEFLRLKKGEKCRDGNEGRALDLLKKLGLPEC